MLLWPDVEMASTCGLESSPCFGESRVPFLRQVPHKLTDSSPDLSPKARPELSSRCVSNQRRRH